MPAALAARAAASRPPPARALAPLGLAADRGDGDVAHRRRRLGAVPVALAGLDVNDVADLDLLWHAALDRDHALARGHHQDLIAGVGVPAGGTALAEIDHAAIVVGRVARLDDRLARARYRPGPAFDAVRALDWQVGDVFQRADLHGVSPRGCLWGQINRNPPLR